MGPSVAFLAEPAPPAILDRASDYLGLPGARRSGQDPEKGLSNNEIACGYAEFADSIASDSELSLYCGFNTLAARNILHLQAVVQVLEKRLQELDARDLAMI
jgi:hypothetical protein